MKDLADSKRLFNTIRATSGDVISSMREQNLPLKGIGPVSATIISALFWPPLQEEQLKLPNEVIATWPLTQPRFMTHKMQ